LPDERWGEAVTAVVLLRPGGVVDEETLIAHCRARLAGFETPKRIVFVDKFPETVGGKIQKHILRASLGGPPVLPPPAITPAANSGARK
jgi:acyl-CoA synthetase (AMP-forming)/AMP-acid ligase II